MRRRDSSASTTTGCPGSRCRRRPVRAGSRWCRTSRASARPTAPTPPDRLHGLTLETSTPSHLARAAVEGLLCGLADGLDALVEQGAEVRRVLLVGGGARSEAVRRVAPAVLGVPVLVPPPGEYVADGAARQAAWVLAGGDQPPAWPVEGLEGYEADPTPAVRARYAEVKDLTAARLS